jgi:hypothetical protein
MKNASTLRSGGGQGKNCENELRRIAPKRINAKACYKACVSDEAQFQSMEWESPVSTSLIFL